MKSRGMSQIITTVIMIGIVLVAVGLVWIVIQNIIGEGLQDVSLGSLKISMNIESVKVTDDGIDVRVKRNSGEANLVGLNFIVSNGKDTEVFEVETNMKELATQTFSLDYIGLVDRVEVAPVLANDEGKEKTYDSIDVYNENIASGKFCTEIFEKGFSEGDYFLSTSNGNVKYYCFENISENNLVSYWEMVGDIEDFDWEDSPEIVEIEGPFGENVFAHNSIETSDSCYNWARTSQIKIEHTKNYEFTIWIKTSDTDLTNYLGFFSYDSSGDRIYEDFNNPYFYASKAHSDGWTELKGTLASSLEGTSSCAIGTCYSDKWYMTNDFEYVTMRFGSCYGDGNSADNTYFSYPQIKEI
ncbi:MAG: hypothetical protein OQK82_02205 [Candidatus Pacearchaeota archaeon]|nr:hypothetical protein [Candidatus Pacearchaeota archaeon]